VLYKGRKFYDDDFDWDNYTADSYARRLKSDIESQFTTHLDPAKASIDAAAGRVTLEGQSVHPNTHLILETVARLSPASVHEVGCGGGDHIGNVGRLFPDVAISGGDRSIEQLRFALQRHPELDGRVGIQDLTMPYSSAWARADLVYSQAVIMHLHTAVSHFVAMVNIITQAESAVLFVENLQCRNLVSDLSDLHAGGHLPWEDLHIHRVDGSTGARGVIASRAALDLPVLTSDDQMRRAGAIQAPA